MTNIFRYGEKPLPFQFEENDEYYYLASEVIFYIFHVIVICV